MRRHRRDSAIDLRAGPLPMLLVLVWLGAAPGSALAQPSPRGFGFDVERVEVQGMPAELGAFPREGLAVAPRRKLLGTQRTSLTKRKLDADRERIRFYLARRGYPDAVVTYRVEANPDKERVAVTFVVEPGPAVRYGTVALAGMPASLEEDARQEVTRTLPPGARFDQGDVEAVRAAVLESLREAGYAHPQLALQVLRPTPDMADLRFTATPGPSFVFGDVTVTGVPPDLMELADRVIGIAPGEPASASRLRDVRTDLRELNLFRQINVVTTTVEPDTLDIATNLSLQAMNSWELSLGTWTDEWIRVRAGWTNRNLFRRGRSLRLEAAYSPHNVEALARTSWPALLLRKSRTDLNLSYNVDSEDNYTQTTAEAELAALFYLRPKTTMRVGFALSVDDVDEGEVEDRTFFGTNPGLTPLVRARLYRDAADHPIEPHTGYRVALSAEWSPPFDFSENPFLWLRGYGSWYHGLSTGTTLATRLDVGAAQPLGDAESLLPSNRFFAGGSSSMRGYKRRRLGPIDDLNEPVGGEVMFLAGAEIRQVIGNIASLPVGATVFLDSGQVWERRHTPRADEIVAALGLGVWLRTPIGPLRLDMARHLGDPMHGDPRTVFHFAMGYAY